MAKLLGTGATNDPNGIGAQPAPAQGGPTPERAALSLAGQRKGTAQIGCETASAQGAGPTGIPLGGPTSAGGSVGFGGAKPATIPKAPERPPVMGRDGKPLPSGATGEITAISTKEFERIEASAERVRTPLSFRLFKGVAHGAGQAMVAAASVPSGFARLVGKGLESMGAERAGRATQRVAAAIRPSDAQATVEAQAPKTWEGKGASFAGQTAMAIPIMGTVGLKGLATQSAGLKANEALDAGATTGQALMASTLTAAKDMALGSLFRRAIPPAASTRISENAARMLKGVGQGASMGVYGDLIDKATWDPHRSISQGARNAIASSLALELAGTPSSLRESAARRAAAGHPGGPSAFASDLERIASKAHAVAHDPKVEPNQRTAAGKLEQEAHLVAKAALVPEAAPAAVQPSPGGRTPEPGQFAPGHPTGTPAPPLLIELDLDRAAPPSRRGQPHPVAATEASPSISLDTGRAVKPSPARLMAPPERSPQEAFHPWADRQIGFLADNPAVAKARYRAQPGSFDGKVVSPDLVAETVPAIRANPIEGHAIQDDRLGNLTWQAWDDRLAPPGSRDERCVLMMGSPASGKTTQVQQAAPSAYAILDAPLTDLHSARSVTNQIVAGGRTAEVALVYRPFDDTVRSMLDRSAEEGRTVSLNGMAKLHHDGFDTFKALGQDARGSSRVGMTLIEQGADPSSAPVVYRGEDAIARARDLKPALSTGELHERACRVYLDHACATLDAGGNVNPAAIRQINRSLTDALAPEGAALLARAERGR